MNEVGETGIGAGPVLGRLPWEMAEVSTRAERARDYILDQVERIGDPALRERVRDMIVGAQHVPAQLTARPHLFAEEELLQRKLQEPLPYDPTRAAPGAAVESHHAYPGGWAIHTALNLQAALNLADQALRLKGVPVRTDALVAAIVLHDWAKMKLLRWRPDHTLDATGGGAHHHIVLAEGMLRGFSADVIQLLAGVHSGWWLRPEAVREYIIKAAAWIEIDADAAGYLSEAERFTIEGWIARQAEAGWYTLTKEALQCLHPVLREWQEQRSISLSFERMHNALFTTLDELDLHQVLVTQGKPRLFERLDTWLRSVR